MIMAMGVLSHYHLCFLLETHAVYSTVTGIRPPLSPGCLNLILAFDALLREVVCFLVSVAAFARQKTVRRRHPAAGVAVGMVLAHVPGRVRDNGHEGDEAVEEGEDLGVGAIGLTNEWPPAVEQRQRQRQWQGSSRVKPISTT